MNNIDKLVANDQPLVSVVVPVFNAELYLEECLRSILDQTYQNIELIVVDDGSTDSSSEIAGKLAAEDSRILLLSQSNQYAGVARNNGLAKAKGRYVLFLDADDYFEKDMIATMVGRAEEVEAEIVICRSSALDVPTGNIWPIEFGLQFVDVNSVMSGADLRDLMFRFCNGWAWDKLYRRDFVLSRGLSFQEYRTTNDALFVFLSLMESSRIAFVDKSLVLHRMNNTHSLEGTRRKSFDNALNATVAIGQELKKREKYDLFERSYINWAFDFAISNYVELDDEAKVAFLERFKSKVLSQFPKSFEQSFFFNENTGKIAAFFVLDLDSLLKRAIDLQLELHHAYCLIGDRDVALAEKVATIEEKDRIIGDRDAEISGLQQTLSEEKARFEWISDSTTYKVGKVIMAVPCALKSRFS